MKGAIAKLRDGARREPVAAVFLVIVCLSFVIHGANRNNHFQECDSTEVYYAIREFPRPALSWAAAYNEGETVSAQAARSLLRWKPAQKIVLRYAKDINGNPVDEEILVGKLSRVNPLGLLRLGTIAVLTHLNVPQPLESFFSVPFSSTYSAGSGLIYGLTALGAPDYRTFMSRALFVTIAIFHAAVLLLWAAARRLGVNPFASAIAALLMLFSINMYSYAYHLGSTVWNIASGALWLFLAVGALGKPDFLKRMSLWTAALIFFNYLIVFYWAGFLLAGLSFLPKTERRPKNISAHLFRIAKSQIPAIASAAFIIIAFFPLGQTNRGTTTIESFPQDFYRVMLNFFSFYNRSPVMDAIQFSLGATLIVAAFSFLIKISRGTDRVASIFARGSLGIGIVFLAAVLSGILGFAPTRHLLFLSPFIFLLAARVFDRTPGKRLRGAPERIVIGAMIGFIAFSGIAGVAVRLSDTRDSTKTLAILPRDLENVERVFVERCAHQLAYRDWNIALPVERLGSSRFVAGKIYLYLGQTNFLSLLNDSPHDRPDEAGGERIEVLDEYSAGSPLVHFIAYPSASRRRPTANGAYKVKFRMVKER